MQGTAAGEYDSQALKASCAALPEGQLRLLCAIGWDATSRQSTDNILNNLAARLASAGSSMLIEHTLRSSVVERLWPDSVVLSNEKIVNLFQVEIKR